MSRNSTAGVKRQLAQILSPKVLGVSVSRDGDVNRGVFISQLCNDQSVVDSLADLYGAVAEYCPSDMNCYKDPAVGDVWWTMHHWKEAGETKKAAMSGFLQNMFSSKAWKLLKASGRNNEGRLRRKFNMTPKGVTFKEPMPQRGGQSYLTQPTPSQATTRHQREKAGDAVVPSNLSAEQGKGELRADATPDAFMSNQSLPIEVSIHDQAEGALATSEPTMDMKHTTYMKAHGTKKDMKLMKKRPTMDTDSLPHYKRSRADAMVEAADSENHTGDGVVTRDGQNQLNVTTYQTTGQGTGGKTTMGGVPDTVRHPTPGSSLPTVIPSEEEERKELSEEEEKISDVTVADSAKDEVKNRLVRSDSGIITTRDWRASSAYAVARDSEVEPPASDEERKKLGKPKGRAKADLFSGGTSKLTTSRADESKHNRGQRGINKTGKVRVPKSGASDKSERKVHHTRSRSASIGDLVFGAIPSPEKTGGLSSIPSSPADKMADDPEILVETGGSSKKSAVAHAKSMLQVDQGPASIARVIAYLIGAGIAAEEAKKVVTATKDLINTTVDSGKEVVKNITDPNPTSGSSSSSSVDPATARTGKKQNLLGRAYVTPHDQEPAKPPISIANSGYSSVDQNALQPTDSFGITSVFSEMVKGDKQGEQETSWRDKFGRHSEQAGAGAKSKQSVNASSSSSSSSPATDNDWHVRKKKQHERQQQQTALQPESQGTSGSSLTETSSTTKGQWYNDIRATNLFVLSGKLKTAERRRKVAHQAWEDAKTLDEKRIATENIQEAAHTKLEIHNQQQIILDQLRNDPEYKIQMAGLDVDTVNKNYFAKKYGMVVEEKEAEEEKGLHLGEEHKLEEPDEAEDLTLGPKSSDSKIKTATKAGTAMGRVLPPGTIDSRGSSTFQPTGTLNPGQQPSTPVPVPNSYINGQQPDGKTNFSDYKHNDTQREKAYNQFQKENGSGTTFNDSKKGESNTVSQPEEAAYMPTLRLFFTEGDANIVTRVNENPEAKKMNRLVWRELDNYDWETNEEDDNDLHIMNLVDEARRFYAPLDRDEFIPKQCKEAIQYMYDISNEVFEIPKNVEIDGDCLILDTRGGGNLTPMTADETDTQFHNVYMPPWIDIPASSPWKKFTQVEGSQLPDSMIENPNRFAPNDAPALRFQNSFITSTYA